MQRLSLVFENHLRATLGGISINGDDHFLRIEGGVSLGSKPEVGSTIEPLFAVEKDGTIYIVFVLYRNLLIASIAPSGAVAFFTAQSKEETAEVGDIAKAEQTLLCNGVEVGTIFNGVSGLLMKDSIFEWEAYETVNGFVAAILIDDGVHLSLSVDTKKKSAVVSDMSQQIGDVRNNDKVIIGTFFQEEGAYVATSNINLDETEKLYDFAVANRRDGAPIGVRGSVKYWLWKLNTMDQSFHNVIAGGWDPTEPFGNVTANVIFLEKQADGLPLEVPPDRRDHLTFNEDGEITQVMVNYETPTFSISFIDRK